MKQKELDEKITAASISILSYCVSRTSNQQDAEDLAQDILYEIVKSAANLRDDRAIMDSCGRLREMFTSSGTVKS